MEWTMKKIAIALSALAGIVFLSGCAYDSYSDRTAYDYGYTVPVRHYYFRDGIRYDCLNRFDSGFCG
jgi:hypothetical protein